MCTVPRGGGDELRPLWAAGAEGQPRDVRVAGRGVARGRARGSRGSAARGGRVKRVAVLTHRRTHQTAGALRELTGAARKAGAMLVFDEDEAGKHGLTAGRGLEVVGSALDREVDLCVVLGGDGTILTALRY